MEINIDEYLSTFDKFTKDPNLNAMKCLMNEFGNPQDKLNIIHVAGTNGKGSVCEMLYSILNKTKYTVGKFISPHLIKFNDGISVNNQDIADAEVQGILVRLSEKINKYNKTHAVSVKWFEAITSLALIYFAEKKCDIVILETGLGGTTDCTNIVNSMISVITNIGFDHVDILGNSIKEITKHKAGIIKKNSDTVALNQEDIVDIIKETCMKNNSKLHIVDEREITNYSYNEDFQKFDYRNYRNLEISLKGKQQLLNSAEVLECVDILRTKGYEIQDEDIFTGMREVIHRARFETLSRKPLIIFDGGHNESAINALQEGIDQYYSNYKKVYIISILITKDYRSIVKNLCEDKDAVFIFTSGTDEKPYVTKGELAEEARKYVGNVYEYELEEAISIAKEQYSDRAIFIVGSFYVYKKVMDIL